MTNEPVELIPKKFRKYVSANGDFYLANGLVESRWESLFTVSRWQADKVLKAAYSGHDAVLETLYQADTAFAQDPEVENSVGGRAWLKHLILNHRAPTETEKYVLTDSRGNRLKQSDALRLLNPVEITERDGVYIVVADVFELPFVASTGTGVLRYDLEDINPETGFLGTAPKLSHGEFNIFWSSDKPLCGVFVNGSYTHCTWTPDSTDCASVRGFIAGTPPIGLIDDEVGTLLERHGTEAEALRLKSLERVDYLERRYGNDPRLALLKKSLRPIEK